MSKNKYSTSRTVHSLALSKMSQVNGTTKLHLSYSDSSPNLAQSNNNILPRPGDIPSLCSLNMVLLEAFAVILHRMYVIHPLLLCMMMMEKILAFNSTPVVWF